MPFCLKIDWHIGTRQENNVFDELSKIVCILREKCEVILDRYNKILNLADLEAEHQEICTS